mgnify:CR=1 FL=1|tara:strand:- start:4405 stop:6003 length:1599 start_codon:yes stop_codon:yes gene_type:complete
MAGYKLTKKQIIKEIVKCGKDPVYFTNTYARISHPLKGQIPFNTYDFQTQLLKDFTDHRFNVILKARQLGISTISGAYVAWLMMFHKEKNVLVVATKFGTASNLVKKVKQIIKNLPPWMATATITIDNRSSFELSNGSQIKASSTSGDAGRSEALSLLVIDEAAHVEGLEELWMGLYPTLSTGGRCIALSTPNGVGNWFHKTFSDSAENRNDFHPTTLKWEVHPDRDKNWFQKETRNMSRRDIAQELECSFLASGESVIHPEDIGHLESTAIEPKYKTAFDRNLWIWEEYIAGGTYLLVADVARGDGKDFSVFNIIKLESMEVVAEYQGKPSLEQFATLLNTTGREYGDCMLVVENNNIGYNILEKLIDIQYPNLYYSSKGSHEYVDPLVAETLSSAIPGFTTSMKTRPLIIAKLEEYIRNKLLKVYSMRLISELRTFVWNNGRPEAMRGYNDDLVMSLAIACWVRDTAILTNNRSVEYSKACLDAMIVANTKINTKIPGQIGYNSSLDIEKTTKNEEAMKQYHDFMWLYKG